MKRSISNKGDSFIKILLVTCLIAFILGFSVPYFIKEFDDRNFALPGYEFISKTKCDWNHSACNVYEMYNKETKVILQVVEIGGEKFSQYVLNPDGTPKLYEGDDEEKEGESDE